MLAKLQRVMFLDLELCNCCCSFSRRSLVYTRDGNFYSHPSVAIPETAIIGTNGAGDAFAAGFLYALHENMGIETAIITGHSLQQQRPLEVLVLLIRLSPFNDLRNRKQVGMARCFLISITYHLGLKTN